MKESGGSIVNISSSTVFEGSQVLAHYVASKAAVIGLTRALARQMGDYRIRVNAVAPGLTRTGRNERVPEELWAAVRAHRCLKRDQLPEDLVGTVVWLVSDDSAFVTGQTVVVDGGLRFV
jgi:NAD(P)-dependent dehydrogenase (short-subunit alcohol dehydrogenase family)